MGIARFIIMTALLAQPNEGCHIDHELTPTGTAETRPAYVVSGIPKDIEQSSA